MDYKLIITERAEELIDNLIYYLLFELKNEQAATHLLNELENVYDRLEYNPWQFPLSHDRHLAVKGYREAIIPKMNYTIVFDVIDNIVYIMGIFHQLEDYQSKL